MGIFGMMDAQNVSANAFFIEQGTYDAEVIDAKFGVNRDDEKQLIITYQVDDSNSEFDGRRVSRYYTLPPAELTNEMFEKLPAEEKKAIRQQMASLKKDLCGQNARFKGLGVPADDLNDAGWDPAVLKGTPVVIGVNNYGEENTGVGVKWVNLREA